MNTTHQSCRPFDARRRPGHTRCCTRLEVLRSGHRHDIATLYEYRYANVNCRPVSLSVRRPLRLFSLILRVRVTRSSAEDDDRRSLCRSLAPGQRSAGVPEADRGRCYRIKTWATITRSAFLPNRRLPPLPTPCSRGTRSRYRLCCYCFAIACCWW